MSRAALLDVLGVVGYGLLVAGAWFEFGHGVALIIAGTVMFGCAVIAAIRGLR